MDKTQQKQNERFENEFLREILTEAAYDDLMNAWNREARGNAKEI